MTQSHDAQERPRKPRLGGFDPIAVAITRPTFTCMVILAILVLGLAALRGIPIDLLPSTDFPVVAVSASYAGSGPEETELLVTKPLEEQISVLSGIQSITSTVGQGRSTTRIQFDLHIPIRKAAEDVRERVNIARAVLPADLDAPLVQTFDPGAFPVMTYGFSGDTNLNLSEFAENVISPRLQQIEGVGAVTISGERLAEADVQVDATKLSSYGLAATTIANTLKAADKDTPGGDLLNGGRDDVLQLRGKYTSIDQIGDTYLKVPGGTSTVQVKDVADVNLVQADKSSGASVNGRPGILIAITKTSDANTVALARSVRDEVAQLQKQMPGTYRLDLVRDQSKFIEDAVDDLETSIVWGGLLAIVIVWLFLFDWRATFIAAVAIPVSLIASVGLIAIAHFTLNMMTMMALSLSVGLLIDDAIVVVDNIYRHLEAGEDPWTAALNGTRGIALAVFAVTLSLVAVFLPIGLISGILGRFMAPFALTVAAAVLVSMVVAFTLTPMLASRVLKPHAARRDQSEAGQLVGDSAGPQSAAARRPRGKDGPSRLERFQRGWEGMYHNTERFYARLLGFSLRHRALTLGVAGALFLASLFSVRFIGTAFVPSMDQGVLMLNIRASAGADVDATQKLARDLEKRILDLPEVQTVFSTIGNSQNGALNSAQLMVRLEPGRRSAAVQEEIRPMLANVVGASVNVRVMGAVGTSRQGGKGFGGAGVTVLVKGGDLDQLKQATKILETEIGKLPGISDVSDNMELRKPEYDMVAHRELLQSSGISEADIMNTIRTLVSGAKIGQFSYEGQDRDIVMRLRKEDRNNMEALMSLLVPTAGGVALPVRDLVTLQRGVGPVSINRDGRMRVIQIEGNTRTLSVGQAADAVRDVVQHTALPDGVHVEMGGDAQQMNDSSSSVKLMVWLAVLFIYMVLASQFESLIHPFTIMLSLPLAMVGALFSLLVAHQTLNIISGIGIVTLMGLVTKNAILLVDCANQLRDGGLPMHEALMKAGPIRLRPILMTTSAMILGMLPMAMGIGAGAETRQAMGVAVVGGLITSTLLTLVVVPVVYTLLDRFTSRGRAERRVAQRQTEPVTA